MSIGETGERLRRATVQVRSGPGASGSGVVWDASGTIVTNAHVVRSGDLTIELWDGRIAKARLGGRDVRRDLAILHVEKRIDIGLLEPARAGDSDRLRVGELVIAVGNPFGWVWPSPPMPSAACSPPVRPWNSASQFVRCESPDPIATSHG